MQEYKDRIDEILNGVAAALRSLGETNVVVKADSRNIKAIVIDDAYAMDRLDIDEVSSKGNYTGKMRASYRTTYGDYRSFKERVDKSLNYEEIAKMILVDVTYYRKTNRVTPDMAAIELPENSPIRLHASEKPGKVNVYVQFYKTMTVEQVRKLNAALVELGISMD